MKELKEKETLVIKMVWVWGTPTVKSCINITIQVSYFEEDGLGLRDERDAFEFSTCHDLGLGNAVLLALTSFGHIFFFEL